MKVILLALLMVFFPVISGHAFDHNLDKNVPTELDDAYPLDYGSTEMQAVVRYTDEGAENRILYQPQVEFGIIPNGQLTLAAAFYSGNADRTDSGNVSGEILYRFMQEAPYRPAAAVAVEAELPTGEHARGVDLTGKLILTKTVGVARDPRVHANLFWKHNAGRDRETERGELLGAVAGFSMQAGSGTTVILDIVREQTEEKGREANLLEAGLRSEFKHGFLLALGGGLGLGGDSEQYRITLALQYGFPPDPGHR